MGERELIIREHILNMIEQEKSGLTFQQLYTSLIEHKIISKTRDDQKLVVSVIREVEVGGQKAAYIVCPIGLKNKEQR